MNNALSVPESLSPVEPWEKQPTETGKAFAAFKVYRDLPPHKRSLRNAVRELYGVLMVGRLRQFAKWSTKYGWVWRCSEWDMMQDKTQRDALIQQIKETRTRTVRIGQALVGHAVDRIKTMKGEDLGDIDLMLRVLSTGHKLETEGLGMDDEETLVLEKELSQTEDDFTTLSSEKLRSILIQRRRLLPEDSKPVIDLEESTDV